MADKRDLSIAEKLAYCRNTDGDGSGSAPEAAAAPAPAESPVEAPAKPAAPKPADAGKMSVADMLAAARAEKGGAGAAPASEKAEPAASAAPVDPSKMSVADMLAAARGEKAAPAAKAAPAKKAAAAKPAAKKAAAAKPAKTGPMDTSSILAAARAGAAKPGPMSKAEAASLAKGDPKTAKKEKPKAPPMPAKPEYAKPAAKKAVSSSTDRRGMLEILFGSMLAIGWGAMVTSAGLASLVLARFFFPNLLIEPPSQFKVGFPGDFAADTVATKFKAQFGVWVVNAEYEGQRQIFALKSVCTHLGCTPNWLEAEQKFKCPCHGSGFYKDGINFEGPAPRPLERYAINIADDGQVAIDKSKTFQEQVGQWGDSASYVPV